MERQAKATNKEYDRLLKEHEVLQVSLGYMVCTLYLPLLAVYVTKETLLFFFFFCLLSV